MENEKNGRGRPKKVTAQEILDILGENTYTKSELAEMFNVCYATISSRLKELRNDSEPIFFDNEGIFLLNSIDDEEDKERMMKYFNWLLGAFKGISRCGNPTRPLMLESKKWIKKHLGKDERKQLALYTMQVNRMIDYVNMEEDLEN
jgi:hypothetical protein